MPGKETPATIDAYLAPYDGEVKERLEALRAAIRRAAPQATEAISWAMPTFKLNGNLVHFAAGKRHIGFYPGAAGVVHFLSLAKEGYKTSKGAVQFPHERPLPLDLVEAVVRFRVGQQCPPAPPTGEG